MYYMDCASHRMQPRTWQWGAPTDTAYRPIPVDVAEIDETYVLQFSVPGVNLEDIHVAVEGDTVSVRAVRPEPAAETSGKLLLQERYTGRLGRTLTLPVDLDSDHTEAALADGVLTLRVKKAETALAKEIPIQKK
jgi:HSP20 family protein